VLTGGGWFNALFWFLALNDLVAHYQRFNAGEPQTWRMSERTSQITPVIVSEVGAKPVAIASCYAREKHTQFGTSQVQTKVAAGHVQWQVVFAFPSHKVGR
jgi:glucose dehydrogenase